MADWQPLPELFMFGVNTADSRLKHVPTAATETFKQIIKNRGA